MISADSSISTHPGDDEFSYTYHERVFRFQLHPKVAKPNYYSFFLAESIDIGNARQVIDIGTGTGFLGLLLSGTYPITVVATDLNPFAVQIATENARLNSLQASFHVALGNLFLPFADRTFDLAICDPPFAPTPLELVKELQARDDWFYCNACGGPDGREVISQLIAQARSYLNPNGRLILVHPDYVDIEHTFADLRSAHLEPRIIARKLFPLGTLGKFRQSYIESKLHFSFTLTPDGTPYQEVAVIEGLANNNR